MDPCGATQKVLVTAVYFVLLGVLLSGLSGSPWQDRRRTETVAVAAFGLSALLFGLKLPVMSRNYDVTDVLIGGCAALASWMLGLECRRHASFRERGRALLPLRAGLLALWVMLVTFII